MQLNRTQGRSGLEAEIYLGVSKGLRGYVRTALLLECRTGLKNQVDL